MRQKSRIYAITPLHLAEDTLFERTHSLLAGGISVLQYRDKSSDSAKRHYQANYLKKLCQSYHCLFIINDDVELAASIGADGVHLGQHDTDYLKARKHLGSKAMIGISCYNNLERALKAQQQGANYVAFGAVFSSPTKPNAVKAPLKLLQTARQLLDIPICAIGGITTENAASVIHSGAHLVALCSHLYQSNTPKHIVQQLRSVVC